MKPGWEDLVRRCIQRFHLQNDGEMSFAKKHQQEGTMHRNPRIYKSIICSINDIPSCNVSLDLEESSKIESTCQ
jgi:hypothetical protein